MEHVTIYTCKNKRLEYYERKHPRTKEDQKVYFDKYSHRRFVFRNCNKKKKFLCKHIDETISEPQFCESTAQFGGLCRKHGDRTCTKEGCTNPPQIGEFCQKHSPNRCGEEGCDNPSHKEGFCMKHHPNRCKEEGCDNAVSAHGFCQKHSPNRCEEEGCDNPSASGGLCSTHMPKKKCKKEGCDRPSHKEGFCMKHHPNRCKEEGCDNAVNGHGFCQKHSPNRCEEEGCDNPSASGGLCTTHTPNNKCRHGIMKYHCKKCSDNKDIFCTKCPRMLSPNRRTCGIKICKTCQTDNTPFESPESQWHKKLIKIGEELGFEVEFYNVIIKTKDGRTINKRRIDYKLKTTKELVYYIIIECDESSHSQHIVCLEMLRLQQVHDQLIARFGFKPMVVIRFNPNYKDKKYLETEMKEALKSVLTGNFECTDYRGINLYPKLIGYSEKRKQQYEDEPNSKRIKYEGNENENITYI
jgi:hypothetical protein